MYTHIIKENDEYDEGNLNVRWSLEGIHPQICPLCVENASGTGITVAVPKQHVCLFNHLMIRLLYSKYMSCLKYRHWYLQNIIDLYLLHLFDLPCQS